MNKNKQEKQNNNLLKYFFIISGIVLLVSIVIRLLLPTQVEIPPSSFQSTNKDGSTSEFAEVINEVTDIEVPETFSIARQNTSQTNFDQVKTDLISSLNLTQTDNVETVWTSDDWYLNYQPNTNEYILLNLNATNEELERSLQPGFDIDELTEFAESQLATFLPNINVSVQQNAIDFWPDDHEMIELTTADRSRFADVPLSYTLDGFPIFYEKEATYPFRMSVYSNLSFGKLTYFPFSVQPNVIGQEESLSIEQALENIRSNRYASIIETFQERGNPLQLDTILSVTFTEVSIEYRFDSEQNLFYPFYRFSGEAETTNDTLFIEVLTPAVEITS